MNMTEAELDTLLKRNPALRVRDGKPASKTSSGVNFSPTVQQLPPNTGKPHAKYRNHKVYVHANGYVDIERDESTHGSVIRVYDSVKEYRRHEELRLLEGEGEIRGLLWQFPLTIQEGFTYRGERVKAITYKADFKYTDAKSGDTVIEDVKGKDMSTGKYLTTEAFRLKWKLLKQRYPEFVFKLF